MGDKHWLIGDRLVDLSRRGLIMGILNVTPDSFSDGGEFFEARLAIAHGARMAAEGADILDVGGESTRPGAEPVSVAEELRRVIPVIEALRSEHQILISIDTTKSKVAAAALAAGANIVNDVTGGRNDAEMFPLVAKQKAALIVMHMQGEPRTMQIGPSYVDVVEEVGNFFRQQYERVLECGIDPMAVAFDPGIGFGKTLEHNLELLGNLERLRVNGRPHVLGVSRKSFLGKIGAQDMAGRLVPTVALTSLLRARGAEVFRVHDVAANRQALRMAEAVLER